MYANTEFVSYDICIVCMSIFICLRQVSIFRKLQFCEFYDVKMKVIDIEYN